MKSIKKYCDDQTDEQLAVMSQGNADFFYCLMERYEKKLTRYLGRFAFMSAEDVEDIVQDSFINAYTHINECDCDLKFSSWIYRIAHNNALNFIKKHKQSLKLNIDEEDDEFVEWLTDSTNIEKETIKKHFHDYVLGLLDRMKPEYKEVILWKFFEDKDYREISDILQKPMGTVATLLSRAKIQFKEIYEKEN